MPELTPKTLFEDTIAGKLSKHPEVSAEVNACYEFRLEGEEGGVWTVDLTVSPGLVGVGSTGAAGCVVTAACADFMDIVSGRLNPQLAFLTGRIKASGELGLLLKLQKVIR